MPRHDKAPRSIVYPLPERQLALDFPVGEDANDPLVREVVKRTIKHYGKPDPGTLLVATNYLDDSKRAKHWCPSCNHRWKPSGTAVSARCPRCDGDDFILVCQPVYDYEYWRQEAERAAEIRHQQSVEQSRRRAKIALEERNRRRAERALRFRKLKNWLFSMFNTPTALERTMTIAAVVAVLAVVVALAVMISR